MTPLSQGSFNQFHNHQAIYMSKIWLVIKREYLTRVRNKTFLLSTFLLPLIFILFIFGASYLSFKGKDHNRIAVYDESGVFKNKLTNKEDHSISFSYVDDTAINKLLNEDYDGYLHIRNIEYTQGNKFDLISKKQLGSTKNYIEQQMDLQVENKILNDKYGINREQLDSIRTKSQNVVVNETLLEGGQKKQIDSGLTSLIGYMCGILIYITMFIYGAGVMRGVMEEKTTRIAEVVISSVRPFQLMMGKILGIGAVGLTQFFLWILLISGLILVAQQLIPHDVMIQVQQLQHSNNFQNNSGMQVTDAAQKIYDITKMANSVNWMMIISCFLFYFLGGYLFYAALFAAVGSAVNEDPQEAQSLMLPIMMPIVFAFIIMSSAIQNPGSSIAVWGSLIPFTSPIVMMGRLPAGVPGTVPYWQLGVSMFLLIAGFIGTTWVASKIYRIGILMYGKKPTFRELFKWIRRSS